MPNYPYYEHISAAPVIARSEDTGWPCNVTLPPGWTVANPGPPTLNQDSIVSVLTENTPVPCLTTHLYNNNEENQEMTTTMTVSDIIVPDIRLTNQYFQDCNYEPTFLTSVPLRRSYLTAGSNLKVAANMINTSLSWSSSPQGSSYWSSIYRNLVRMNELLLHCHRVSIWPQDIGTEIGEDL